MTSIAVVGGSLAGLSTVRALRAEGYDGSITVIGEERHHPYDRPPLSKGFLKGGLEAGALALGNSPSTGATGMTSPCSPSTSPSSSTGCAARSRRFPLPRRRSGPRGGPPRTDPCGPRELGADQALPRWR